MKTAKYINIVFKDNHSDIEDDFKKFGLVDITIDLESKEVVDYPFSIETNIWAKVTDTGSYYLLDENKNIISSIEGEYVPKCIPNEYCDYINLEVDRFGVINNWADWEFNVIDTIQEQFLREAE